MPEKRGPKPRISRHDWARAIMEWMQLHGSMAFSIEALAANREMSKGSFYHYFTSKKEGISAALELWVDEENAVLSRFAPNQKADIQQLVDGVFKATREFTRPVVFFLIGLADRNPEYRSLALQIQEARFSRMRGLLAGPGSTDDEEGLRAVYVLCALVGLSYLDSHGLLDLPSIPGDGDSHWENAARLSARILAAAAG